MENIQVTGFSNRSKFIPMSEPIIRAPIKRRHVSYDAIVPSHKVKAKFVTDAPKDKVLTDGWLFTISLLCLLAGGACAAAFLVLTLVSCA